MAVTTIEGVVENGAIRLRDNVTPPENTKVYVIVPDANERPAARVPTPRLAHPDQSH